MATCYCEKCTKTMDDDQFYTYKDGSKTKLCKKCLTMHIDNFNPETYLWILKDMDVPYIPAEWNTLLEKAYAKNPDKINGMSVLGKYLSKMKLKQWNKYTWADTEKIQAENEEKEKLHAAMAAEREALAKEQYEKGEINEAQYKTLTGAAQQEKQKFDLTPPTPQAPQVKFPDPFADGGYLDQSELIDVAADLTQDDRLYLAMKWGRLYKPHEWVALEQDYKKMKDSFDIQDADTENTLMLLCKTNLKANQAIDSGDFEGFQKLSRVSESLRKTAKFTAAQNKEQKQDFVDSIGELVAMCEREGGFIPRFVTDVPQDKVDQTLKDMNGYLNKLVTQDLGFGQQIEDSLKKIQIQKEMNDAEERKEKTGDYDELENEDYETFFEQQEDLKNADEDAEVDK